MKSSKAGNYAPLAHPPLTKTSTKSRTTFSANHAQGRAQEARIYSHSTHERGDIVHDTQADVPSTQWLEAQLAFKVSMVHGILQFTPSKCGLSPFSFAMGKKKTTRTPAHSPPPTTVRKEKKKKSTRLVVDDEMDCVNTVDAGIELSDEEKGEPSVQSSFDTSIDEDEVARTLQISLEKNLEAILADDIDNTLANEQPLNKETPPDNVADTPLEQPISNEEKEKEKEPLDAGKSGDKLKEDKVDKPADAKKSFASFFKKNRAEDKGMKLHKVVAPKCFIPEEDMLTVEEIWGPCLVGCFTGRFPGLIAIQKLVDSCGVKCKFLPHHQGWVVFKFLTNEDRDSALLHAKKELNNKKLLINIPPDDFMWDVKSFSTMLVWVKLWNVPMRMLINMDLSLTPPTSVEVDFVGGSYVQKVEYEDMPQYCYHCKCFGHDPFKCSVLHEINKRKFNEEQKARERARVETLKTIMLTEAQQQPLNGKENGKDEVNNIAGNKGKGKESSGGVAQNPNDPGPSFTAHIEDDGFTQVGGGKGKLTTHPIRDGKQRTGYNKGGGDFSGPWAVMGDFNAVISSTKRVNCQTQSAYYMTDLRQFRINNALNDANSSGLEFTWNKGEKWAKLDRVLVNDEWENMQWDCWAEFRDMEAISDHCPVLLKLMNILNQRTRPFKFYNMWLKHENFDMVIRENWNQWVNGTRQYRLCVKLKKLKQPLRLLNKQHFAHISQRAESARKEYSHLMQELILEPENPSLLSRSVELRNKASFFMDAERSFFQQKTKCELLFEGDKCTKFFHALMRKKNHSSAIPFILTVDQRLTTSLEEVEKEFTEYFTNLFGTTVPIEPVDWNVFEEGPLIPNHAANNLIRKVTIEEITHIAFADDIMMFSRGDKDSVQILADALKHFSSVSGLHVNAQKSNIYLAGQIKGNKQHILNLVNFPEGLLPVKYLGLPLTSQRASKRDFTRLIETVDDNIRRWNTKTLTIAGRAELIRSVIQGIEVAWDDICKPKEEGGLGLKNSEVWNQALVAKNLWNIASRKETLWVQWVHSVYLQDRDIWAWIPKHGDSHFFKKLAEVRNNLAQKLGTDQYQEVDWDELLVDGEFCTTKVYDLLRVHLPPKPCMKMIWQSYIPPKFSVTTWLAIRRRLSTKVNLGFIPMENRNCSLCGQELETTDHLFFACTASHQIWKNMKDWLKIPYALSTIERVIKWLLGRHRVHGNLRNIWRLAAMSTIHHIWKMRNAIYFEGKSVDCDAITWKIKPLALTGLSWLLFLCFLTDDWLPVCKGSLEAWESILDINFMIQLLDWGKIEGQLSRATVHRRHLQVEFTSVWALFKANFWGIMSDMECSFMTINWIFIPFEGTCDLSKFGIRWYCSQRCLHFQAWSTGVYMGQLPLPSLF
ncbi:unnamed protein product, partial [Cuscuta campestris]